MHLLGVVFCFVDIVILYKAAHIKKNKKTMLSILGRQQKNLKYTYEISSHFLDHMRQHPWPSKMI